MIYPKTSWLIGLGFLAGTLGACAGKLDNPERFRAAVTKYQSGGGTGGSSPSAPRGSEDDASVDDGAGEGGSGGSGGSTGEPPACVLKLFKDSCALAACHVSGLPQVDLASDGVADRLIDQTSDSATCKGRTFIATDGSSSLLVDKLAASPPCGAKMPLVGTLSLDSKKCLTDWVDSLSDSDTNAGDETDAGAEP